MGRGDESSGGMRIFYLGVIACVIWAIRDFDGFKASVMTTFQQLLAG